jgi:nitrite reductase (NADH) large subunit
MSQPCETLALHIDDAIVSAANAPIVIVGNGPVGMQVARELLRRRPASHVVIYGNECHRPYNRVQLSYLLSGELDWEALLQKLEPPATAVVEERMGCAVLRIDTERQRVEDSFGRSQPYAKLILATGSRPHIPSVPGIDLPGVYTFRNLDDASRLLARQMRTQHTVVLGGGLLGLEAARSMQRSNTLVTVVEHADRLLGRQLDEDASDTLRTRLMTMGINVIVADGVRRIIGDQRVEGLLLMSGRRIDCDTVVVATGIRPNVDLALGAGIAFSRGIRVDDHMRTSKPNVYAVGECAEHRGRVYGVVAPGLEQAAVAANDIDGSEGSYPGSIVATSLKVVGCPVFSSGPMGAGESPNYGQSHVYREVDTGIYRRILVHQGRLIGAIGVGGWEDTSRLQGAIALKQRVWPWQVWRFRRTGSLWPREDVAEVTSWPANATVCQCTGVSRGVIGAAIGRGACTLQAVTETTGAAGVCGSCRPLVQQLLGAGSPEPVLWYRLLAAAATVSLFAVLAMAMLPAIPYADSVQVAWRWDTLWRDGLWKQVSGFTVLGLFVVGLLMSPRKRITKLQGLGRFDGWRLLHILLGLLVVTALLVHTGMRLGSGLNLLLMVSFSATLLLGAIATGLIAFEHRIGGAAATRLRRKSVWWHILFFWPVPVALAAHVAKSYYF